jgi:hypothetical protein
MKGMLPISNVQGLNLWTKQTVAFQEIYVTDGQVSAINAIL